MNSSIHDGRADRVLRVELKGVRSKKALLEALATGLALPRHFGHNWDALADCLMDEQWAKSGSICVLLMGSAGAERRFGAEWTTLADILGEAADWWRERGRDFHTVLA